MPKSKIDETLTANGADALTRQDVKRAAMSREWHLKRDRKFRKKLAQVLKSERAR